jgi:outer membrane protein TolC
MSPAPGSHEPTAEFRAHLEWQVESALRRETRLSQPVGGRLPRLRAAVMVVAAFAFGGIAVGAGGQLKEVRQRDVLIEAARSEESILRVRLDLARAEYDQARRRFEVGIAGRETLSAAEREVSGMETALKRVLIDMDEIQATSAAPRNELQAPLVGRRDFVRERLALDLDTAQHALIAAEQALEEATKRVKAGLVPTAAQLQAEYEVLRARLALQLVQARLEQRQRFMAGLISADEVSRGMQRTESTVQQERVRRELEIARARVEDVRRLVGTGVATPIDLKRAELDVLEREAELQRIRQESEMLRGRGGNQGR